MQTSPTVYIQNLHDKLITLQLAEPHEIIGCTEAEIEILMTNQGVTFLPELYRQFLLTLGKQSGLLFQGTDAQYKYLMGMKEAAVELLQENGKPFALPADAFVFRMHQGYTFFYFLTGDKNENPPIYRYLEMTDQTPFKKWDTLDDYFTTEVEGEISYWAKNIEKRLQKGLSPRPTDGVNW
ncbi:MAG: SMI1/KNR4 family protein [Anaerolineae bacterium]|nr:SMI1/KNR4 family protein [Anaerolineae bacterium]